MRPSLVIFAITQASLVLSTPLLFSRDDDEKKTRSNGTLGLPYIFAGGDELQAVSFFGSAGMGAFEVEYQNKDPRAFIVVENKNPAPAPAGYVFADTSSYVVGLSDVNGAVTRQQIDYVFNMGNADIKAKAKTAKTGKLTSSKTWDVSSAVGVQDFEDDEGESKLTLPNDANMIGEWAVFFPSA